MTKTEIPIYRPNICLFGSGVFKKLMTCNQYIFNHDIPSVEAYSSWSFHCINSWGFPPGHDVFLKFHRALMPRVFNLSILICFSSSYFIPTEPHPIFRSNIFLCFPINLSLPLFQNQLFPYYFLSSFFKKDFPFRLYNRCFPQVHHW